MSPAPRASSPVVTALLEALTEEDLAVLAERLRPHLSGGDTRCDQPASASSWLDAKGAAVYLGISVNALHKHTARRAVPSHQDGPGCKLWFRTEELDAWRRGE